MRTGPTRYQFSGGLWCVEERRISRAANTSPPTPRITQAGKPGWLQSNCAIGTRNAKGVIARAIESMYLGLFWLRGRQGAIRMPPGPDAQEASAGFAWPGASSPGITFGRRRPPSRGRVPGALDQLFSDLSVGARVDGRATGRFQSR